MSFSVRGCRPGRLQSSLPQVQRSFLLLCSCTIGRPCSTYRNAVAKWLKVLSAGPVISASRTDASSPCGQPTAGGSLYLRSSARQR
jgi:hypothetical protein